MNKITEVTGSLDPKGTLGKDGMTGSKVEKETILRKIEIPKKLIQSFEVVKDRIHGAGVLEYSLTDYMEFLEESITERKRNEHINSKIPLKARVLSAIENGNESLLLEIQRVLEKKESRKSRRGRPEGDLRKL